MPNPPRRAKANVLSRAQYRQTGSEHSLQVSVLEYLKLNAKNPVYWFAVPNAGKRSWQGARDMKAEGLTAGVADLCIMLPEGRVAWLEMKTPKGRRSDMQDFFEDVCDHLQHPYATARTFDEAIAILRRWGALKEPK